MRRFALVCGPFLFLFSGLTALAYSPDVAPKSDFTQKEIRKITAYKADIDSALRVDTDAAYDALGKKIKDQVKTVDDVDLWLSVCVECTVQS